MERKIVMNALAQAEKNYKEQQYFWEVFNDIWPPTSEDEKQQEEDYCLQQDIDDYILDKVVEALKECNNNRTHAAKKLGIKRETLLAKMKKFCLS